MTVNLLKRWKARSRPSASRFERLRDNHQRDARQDRQPSSRPGATPAFADCRPTFDEPRCRGRRPARPRRRVTIGGKVQISLADMDLPSWEHDLRSRPGHHRRPAGRDGQDHPERRRQAAALKTQIRSKIAEPHQPRQPQGPDLHRLRRHRRLPLRATSRPTFWQAQGLHTGKVTGTDAPKIHAARRATTSSRCSPCSRRAPRRRPSILPERTGEIDILIGTDCISEGQNLQDCDYLINYDIHWNPVRIIQRFGRIDRIGSPNSQHPARQLLARHHAGRVHQSQGAGRKPHDDRRRHRHRRRQRADRQEPTTSPTARSSSAACRKKSSSWRT